jgi:hypothetical protein
MGRLDNDNDGDDKDEVEVEGFLELSRPSPADGTPSGSTLAVLLLLAVLLGMI